jgi:hypothetical protein
MRRVEGDEWIRSHDMPHEHIMEQKDLVFDDLDESIQAMIRHYNNVFRKALNDGYIDEEEEKELITLSYKIAKKIKEQLGEPPKGSSGLMGVFAGIGIALGTVFGINQIRKT